MAKLTPQKLTPKQEKFCQKYIELGNASEAYRQSYDCQNMKPETIKRKAQELLNHGTITATISQLQSNHAKRHQITVDDLLAELEEVRTLALIPSGEHGTLQLNVAVSAIMGKAKLLGLAKQSQLEIELKKIELERLKLDKGIQSAEPVQVIVEVKNARKDNT